MSSNKSYADKLIGMYSQKKYDTYEKRTNNLFFKQV